MRGILLLKRMGKNIIANKQANLIVFAIQFEITTDCCGRLCANTDVEECRTFWVFSFFPNYKSLKQAKSNDGITQSDFC